MNENKYIKKLNDVLETSLQILSNDRHLTIQQYRKYCKEKSTGLKSSDYRIEKNHTLEEYFSKYERYFDKSRALVYLKEELYLLNKKKKYWEIPNTTDAYYFEIPTIKRPLLIILLSLLVAGGVAGGSVGVYLWLKPQETINYTMNFVGTKCSANNKDSYPKDSDVSFTITPDEGYVLPTKEKINVEGITEYNYEIATDGIATFHCTMTNNVVVKVDAFMPEITYEAKVSHDEHSKVTPSGSLTNHKPGDVVTFTIEVEEGEETDYKYGLPLDIGANLKVDNAADATYEYDAENDEGTLVVTFGEHDININFTAIKYCTSEDIGCIEEYDPSGEYITKLSIKQFRDAIIAADESVDWLIDYKFLLTEDLDIDDFEPLSSPSYSFASKFDGNNKTIKISNDNCIGSDFGLFGYISTFEDDEYVEIKDLNLYVDLTSSVSSPKQFIGALAGESFGYVNISNVNVYGKINSNRITGGLIASITESSGFARGGSITNITNCKVNADLSAYSLYDSDQWLVVGGIVGQSRTGWDDGASDHEPLGLHITNCSYSGNINVDPNEKKASSYLGYAMAKAAAESSTAKPVKDKTVIDNFTVSADSTLTGYADESTWNYPFEAINKFNGEYPYDLTVGPNHNKELVGGYFHTVIIDDAKTTFNAQGCYPHGGQEVL